MAYHAKLAPSSAARWSDCTASISAQDGLSDSSGEAARLGTCQHQLSAECLESDFEAQSYLGKVMSFYVDAAGQYKGEDWETEPMPEGAVDVSFQVCVVQEMIDAASAYINFVRRLVDTSGAALHVEQPVPIAHITGESGATGTADAVLTGTNTLWIIDAKFGRAKVNAYDVVRPAGFDPVTGEGTPEVLRMNLQLALYLLGSLEKFGLLGDYTEVKAIIVQPYLNHVSEYSCSVDELLALGAWLAERAEATRTAKVFSPSEDNCHFCRARFHCEARQTAALQLALEGFDDIDTAPLRPITTNQLGSLYAKLGLLMEWCGDVQTKVFEELSAGRPVMRNDGMQYKLVIGKKGNRQWRDPDQAEAAMKRMRLKREQMYVSTLISPAAAEKMALAKKPKKGEAAIAPAIGATQWSRLENLIYQKEGSPTVALETDPRPAIGSMVDGFENVEAPAVDSCSDLF